MRLQNKATSIAALLLATPLLLVGCADEGGAPTGPGTGLVAPGGESPQAEKPQVTEPKSGKDTPNADKPKGGDVKVETNGNLPKGFPSEAIVPKGDITFSGEADGGYSVLMLADEKGIDSAIESMKSSGWKEALNMGTKEGRIVSLENSKWSVGMIVGKDKDSGKMSVIYTVTPAN